MSSAVRSTRGAAQQATEAARVTAVVASAPEVVTLKGDAPTGMVRGDAHLWLKHGHLVCVDPPGRVMVCYYCQFCANRHYVDPTKPDLSYADFTDTFFRISQVCSRAWIRIDHLIQATIVLQVEWFVCVCGV